MADFIGPEPLQQAPSELLEALQVLLFSTNFLALCLLGEITGTYTITDDGKKFFLLAINALGNDIEQLKRLYPEYHISLQDVTWDLIQTYLTAGVWPTTERVLEHLKDAIRMLQTI